MFLTGTLVGHSSTMNLAIRPPYDKPTTLNSPWKLGSARIASQAYSHCVSKFSKMEVSEPSPTSTQAAYAPVPSAIWLVKSLIPLWMQASPNPWNTAVGTAAKEMEHMQLVWK